jgi:predicted TIM-barrel fold metal-dependent hydrolase
MDEANVGLGLLSAWHAPSGVLISNSEVAELVDAHPGRFAGVATVDLNDPMGAVREIRRCVRDLGFVAVRVVPWLWNLPPNDRRYYPIYVACVEQDVPFCTQIGHTGPLCPSEPGRPIPYLDEVLLDFPELIVIGGHVGYPWSPKSSRSPRSTRTSTSTRPRTLCTGSPRNSSSSCEGRGRTRVLFGSNYPMITPAQCLKRLGELGLDAEATELFLAGNARRIFRTI